TLGVRLELRHRGRGGDLVELAVDEAREVRLERLALGRTGLVLVAALLVEGAVSCHGSLSRHGPTPWSRSRSRPPCLAPSLPNARADPAEVRRRLAAWRDRSSDARGRSPSSGSRA